MHATAVGMDLTKRVFQIASLMRTGASSRRSHFERWSPTSGSAWSS